jgi:hypothetical protein
MRLTTAAVAMAGALGIAVAPAMAQVPGAASGRAGGTFSCTASAGLTKADTASLTGDVQRTGSYDVKVSTEGDQIRVAVEPQAPKRSGAVTRVAASIDNLLLRSPFKSEAIAQPSKIDKAPVQWSGGPSGAVTGNRAVAAFDLKAVQTLPAGDVLVIVNTADGERVCRMKAKDRRRIAGG